MGLRGLGWCVVCGVWGVVGQGEEQQMSTLRHEGCWGLGCSAWPDSGNCAAKHYC